MRNFSFIVADEQQLLDSLNKLDLSPANTYLIQICSTQGAEHGLAFSEIIRSELTTATVIGHSTSNYIYNAEIKEHGSLILITEFTDTRLTSALIPISENQTQDSLSLTDRLAMSSETKAVISFADGITSKDRALYSSFDALQNEVPVAGGAAQQNAHGTWVLLNSQIAKHAVAAVALHGDKLSIWHGGFIEWNPVGRFFEVTEVEGNAVVSLNNQPCYDVYRHYLAEDKSLSIYDLNSFPLMLGNRTRQNVFVPTRILPDGAIEFNEPLTVGDKVRFSYNHPSLTLEQVQNEAEQLVVDLPDILFIYNCSSRLNFAESNNELKAFQAVAPTQGSYFAAELCRTNQQYILHHSLTYLALREGEPDVNRVERSKQDTKRDKISPLFSLIHNAIADADKMHSSMELRLKEQTRKLTESYRVDLRTSLPNRVALRERLQKMRLNDHLVTMKLTNFRQINEKYGYQIGDQLLRELSQFGSRYFESRFPGNYIFSIGVGEWALVLKSDATTSSIKRELYEFTEKLEHIDFKPEGISEMDYLSVSLNTGLISRRDYPELSVDEMLIKSIEARRWARINNHHVCNAKQLEPENDKRQSQLNWLSCVSKAIISNNVLTYAQPIVEANSHKEVACECLVRIKDGERLISPGQFLPIIEGTHLYTRLSRQMITNTFSLMKERQEAFSINLSPQDMLSDKTIKILEQYLLAFDDPSRVGLEVLESQQIHDYGRMIEVCNHLKNLGARIIVDDFGSGYSNIDEIIKLEPQVIKIDGSLIKNIDTDPRQRKVTQTMIQLCKVVGATTVAEFVHNEQVCKIAEDLGVDFLQGYYFGEPTLLG
ncbi:EAL domain-containing protein [Vibrio sp. JC009]|uniref:bifunctional diguanylate cyclase/phosphodiesterase n=1 Tax=Vibrio sp. JC009 TaxID=2912314 RepID=UPI0023B09421|nr:EAL domain-containing protein [Vibrio sp. JC009]WED21778.1 EAL domain-containing protein [Vibrio sp. JC009]